MLNQLSYYYLYILCPKHHHSTDVVLSRQFRVITVVIDFENLMLLSTLYSSVGRLVH